jgi:galactose mutarotase-like enzyme
MKSLLSIGMLGFFCLPLLVSAGHAQNAVTGKPEAVEIGGQKTVTLTRAAVSTRQPEFTSVTVLPGRGMEVLRITANFPGKGNVEVLDAPELTAAAQNLNQDDDEFGDHSFYFGAAFLVPYPNRIRGKVSADGKTITTAWQGHTLTLPANCVGRTASAEHYAMHGLILKAKTNDLKIMNLADGQRVTGILHAGDFGGHWLSKTDLIVTITLTAEAVDATVTAFNVGGEAEPMAIAWHPYFRLPSGDRTQARVRVPAADTAEVDSYENVFPTGRIVPVDGTRFDLRAAGGQALGSQFFDDNWNHIDWKDGAATVEVIDPKAHYGIKIEGLSPEIKSIQIYAPPARSIVAVEHQYNFGDPFGKEWGTTDSGMVTLKPGQSTTWHVRLGVFVAGGQ